MTLLGIVIVLVVIGVALYLVSLIPMDATVKRVIQVIVILFVVSWVLGQIGLIPHGALKLK